MQAYAAYRFGMKRQMETLNDKTGRVNISLPTVMKFSGETIKLDGLTFILPHPMPVKNITRIIYIMVENIQIKRKIRKKMFFFFNSE